MPRLCNPVTHLARAVEKVGTWKTPAMVGITDSMNVAHKGLYKELQSIPPGGKWEASFWLRPNGF